MEFAVLVANWNGADVIERCLRSIRSASRGVGGVEAIVTDDASSDDSPLRIATDFPDFRLLRLEKNVGFGAAVNEGMRAARAPWVFLLNNDLVLEPDCLARLAKARDAALARAGEGRVFAVGARTVDWETSAPNHGGMRAAWDRAWIAQRPFEADILSPAHFVQGGACLVDRAKFLAMGGFHPIFHPGYWEDYDLSYHALRRGWTNWYEPRAVVRHWGARSMSAALGERRGRVVLRNHLLFNWLNLHDRRLTDRHLLGLGGLALRSRAADGTPLATRFGPVLGDALRLLPRALETRRARMAEDLPTTDREILGLDANASNGPS